MMTMKIDRAATDLFGDEHLYIFERAAKLYESPSDISDCPKVGNPNNNKHL